MVEKRERLAIELCSGSSIVLEKVSERLKHLAVRLLGGYRQSLSLEQSCEARA